MPIRRKVLSLPKFIAQTRRKKTGYYKSRRIKQKRQRNAVKVLKVPRFGAYNRAPDQMHVKLVQSGVMHIESTPDVYYDVIYRGDSVFDPLNSGSSSPSVQPAMFDQYCGLYGEYTVSSSSIHLTHLPKTATFATTTTESTNVCLIPMTTTSAVTSSTICSVMPAKNTNTTTLARTHIRHFCSRNRLYGVKTSLEHQKCQVTTNPSSQPWYWHIFMRSLDQTSTIETRFQYTLTYWVTFSKRKQTPDA